MYTTLFGEVTRTVYYTGLPFFFMFSPVDSTTVLGKPACLVFYPPSPL